MFLQKTLKGKAVVEGFGLHSGLPSTLSFCPCPPGTGIHLVRRDLKGSPSIPIHVDFVKATRLATVLGGEDFVVSTVEHCLSALAALRVDNVYLELEGREIPIGDGSARPFFDRLREVGTIEQGEPRKYIYITRPIYCGQKEKHAYVVPYNGLRLSCTIDFDHKLIGRQFVDVDINEQSFDHELASARTFGFVKDLEKLRQMGLALGASLDNAIGIDEDGIVNPGDLYFENEFVRHKAMDALGDLMTLGRPLMGHVVLYKAGHDLLNHLVRKILQSPHSYQEMELGGAMPDWEDFDRPFS